MSEFAAGCEEVGKARDRPLDGLPLLGDQDAYTGPMIMPKSGRRSGAQGHHAHVLSSEWVPRLKVLSDELCASVRPGKSIGRYRRIGISFDHNGVREDRVSQ